MGLLGLLAAGLFAFYTVPTEQGFRFSGFALQVVGMMFAVTGLLKIRTHFDQPSLRQLIRDWCQRFPKWRQHHTLEAEAGRYRLTASRPRLSVWAQDNPDHTAEQRIHAIAQNQERVRQELSEIFNQHTRLETEVRQRAEEHESALETVREEARSDLETVHTSDIVISLVGLLWLTVGITMSTLAPELASMVGG